MITIENSSINQMLAHELMKNIQAFSTSMERMASGLKINSAKDDPFGFYLSSRFTTQINGLTVANNNIQNAIDILGQADESLKEIDELLGKMRDLIESSCSEYLTPSEREENQKKINAYFQQALQIKDETEVDGRKIFSEKISLDKNVTYTDGHAVTEAGNALAASFVDDSTPAAQPASMPVVDSGTDSGADNGVAAADFVDSGMAAYSPEDEWGAVYSPEDDYGSLYDESAYSDDEEETAFVFDDGVQNAGIAMADTEGDGIACYSGEEDPNAGISIASETGNDGIAVASTIVDSGSIAVTSTSQTITIGDKMYDVHGSGTLNWSIDDAGQITFQSDSTDYIYITAHDGQQDNVVIDGSTIEFFAGDLDDTIVVEAYGYGAYLGSGNDSFINNGTVGHIYGGDGNDSIINNGTVNYDFHGEDGADTITNNGVVSNGIYGQDLYSSDTSTNDTLIYGANSTVGGYGINDVQTAFDNNKITGFETILDENGNDLLISFDKKSGSVTVAGGETKTITIGDKTYQIYGGYDEWGGSPCASSGGTINWSIDKDGQITFSSDDKSSDHVTKGLTVYAADGQNDNVSIDGNICFHAGDLDDIIIVKEGVFASYIFAGDGNDSIVNDGTIHHCIHADKSSYGNDTIINNGQVGGYIWAYGGDDYLVNNGNIEWTLDGDSGNDTVVYSVNSSVGGALSSSTNGNIRGVENFEATNPTFGTITQNGTYTIDDKTYTVSDLSGSIDWSVEDGVITFSGNTATITAADGQADNVSIDGQSSISFDAGDMNDTIIINENSKAESINAGDGDDKIINYGYISTTLGLDSGNDIVWNYGGISGSLYGEEGDDTIINATDAYVSTINGSDGNDSIVNNGVIYYATSVGYGNDTIINNGTMGIGTDTYATGNIYVENNENGYLTSLGLGNGNDYVINKGIIYLDSNAINLGAGNDTFYDYSDGHSFIDAGDGDDYLYIYSEGNHIDGYHGNDYIYIHGNDNHVDGHEGDDMIFVYSDGNEIAGGGGSDDIMISGDNNIAYGQYSTAIDNDFNTITTSGKNNTYSGFDELNNGNQSMNIQTDWNINDYSSYTLNLDLFLPEIEFDISTAENAQLSLTQLDEIIKGLSTSRTSIGAQNLVLEEQLNHNTIRMSNIENSRSIIRDADTAEEYNNLITQASMVQQIQTLQAQANSNHYNLVSQLIYGVVA